MRNVGYLALVLHAHLPYVHDPEIERHLEENWFYQALTECYIPLVQVIDGLYRDGVRFALTISLSPPLVTMLGNGLMQERYVRYLERLLQLADRERQRLAADPDMGALADMYGRRLEEIGRVFRSYDRNLITAFGKFREKGSVELITTTATHGYLPLMRTEEARRAQIRIGVENHVRNFGHPPAGLWLPECGYMPGVDELLQECGLRYFFTDTHGLVYARPHPRHGVYAPVYCPSGVAAFARDSESSRQVWDRLVGYPGDPDYREYYRDIGYDLDWDYLAPYVPAEGVRTDTGFKYYRITEPGGGRKEVYRPEDAARKVEFHARHFLQSRRLQAESLRAQMDRPPVMVAPYDAELFGHWWFEGPAWVDALLRRAAGGEDGIEAVTPARYLERHPENEVTALSLSSWGAGGYSEVWLNETNDWIYRHTHLMETRMRELADLHYADGAGVEPVLNRAARELLLAQSSDWAFIIKTGTAVEYARRRLVRHINRFDDLVGALEDGAVPPPEAQSGERDEIFPDLDFRVYSHHYRAGRTDGKPFRVLMLSWEYPPVTIGGLGRHVRDLSTVMAGQGDEIHVLTGPAPDRPGYEVVSGVHVHRVPGGDAGAQDFLTQVRELNSGMIELAGGLRRRGAVFDLVHGHDWLVGRASRTISGQFGIPNVVTIHATEAGRHSGLHNELQRYIHGREKQLARDADALICCSRYMAEEIERLFEVPSGELTIIPNGVDPATLGITGWSRKAPEQPGRGFVLFIGRLVPEKGVQVLLRALALVSPRFPDLRLVVAGTGPYLPQLRALTAELGLTDRVEFPGFVDGEDRNRLFREASAAVFPSLYEPFGIVALEAMSVQIPVIVSDTGGLGEVVEHGVDGFKVQPDRPDLLAYYLAQIVASPDLSQQMARKAWRKVLTLYDWRFIAERTKDVYRTVVGSR